MAISHQLTGFHARRGYLAPVVWVSPTAWLNFQRRNSPSLPPTGGGENCVKRSCADLISNSSRSSPVTSQSEATTRSLFAIPILFLWRIDHQLLSGAVQ